MDSFMIYLVVSRRFETIEWIYLHKSVKSEGQLFAQELDLVNEATRKTDQELTVP